MDAAGKLMSVKEEKAVVHRERHVYRVDAEVIKGRGGRPKDATDALRRHKTPKYFNN